MEAALGNGDGSLRARVSLLEGLSAMVGHRCRNGRVKPGPLPASTAGRPQPGSTPPGGNRGAHGRLLLNGAVHVAALWRYPVKSLGGEALEQATLTADGVEGDRRVHVSTPHGLVTGRTRHALLTIPASTGERRRAARRRAPWDSIEASQLVADAIRVPSRLSNTTAPSASTC